MEWLTSIDAALRRVVRTSTYSWDDVLTHIDRYMVTKTSIGLRVIRHVHQKMMESGCFGAYSNASMINGRKTVRSSRTFGLKSMCSEAEYLFPYFAGSCMRKRRARLVSKIGP